MAKTSARETKQHPAPHASSRPNQTAYHFTRGAAHTAGPRLDLLPLHASFTEQDFLIGEHSPAEERD